MWRPRKATATFVLVLVLGALPGACRREPPAEEPRALAAPVGAGAPVAPAPTLSPPPAEEPPPSQPLDVLEGKAAYYSDALAGRKTASGEPYDPRALTAAHRSLPFGTLVRVVRAEGDRAVVVRINDRGPFGDAARILDLSRAAAERLDMIRAGVVGVRAEVLRYGAGR